jgi:hypothetical protein
MNDLISPAYLMKLITNVEKAIWAEYESYKNVKLYISKWHIIHNTWNDYWENFAIVVKANGEIDLSATLHGIDGETLIKIAVDLGVETPDFIPSIPTFRNEIKSDYKTASATFDKAFKQIETHPDIAISLANSALESIIKEIFKDERISTKPRQGKTLYDLTSELFKEFQIFPESHLPIEVKTIGSSLLSVCASVEKLRSEKTNVHGKTTEDYVIEDPLYTYFIVNSVATVVLFIKSYYILKFPKKEKAKKVDDPLNDLPF